MRIPARPSSRLLIYIHTYIYTSPPLPFNIYIPARPSSCLLIYMYVYIYIYIYIYINVYLHIHMYLCVCVCVYIYIYRYIHICIYTRMCRMSTHTPFHLPVSLLLHPNLEFFIPQLPRCVLFYILCKFCLCALLPFVPFVFSFQRMLIGACTTPVQI